MNLGLYDKDCITWDPQGDIPQVYYTIFFWVLNSMRSIREPGSQIKHATYAVSMGTPVIGLKSDTHCILGCYKKQQSQFSSHDRKFFGIDDHCGIGIAGLQADARTFNLCSYKSQPHGEFF